MSLLNKSTLTFLFLWMFAANAQERPKVLYVPFQELGFVTAFALDELVFANDFEMNAQTTAINDSVFYFLKESTKHLDYRLINAVEYHSIEQAIQPIYRDDPVPHYGINFLSIQQTGVFQKLIETYQVDYVLFISKYHIAKRVLLANESFNGTFAIPWSNHFVDYELYDRAGNLVALSNRLDLKPNDPTQETFEMKGLSLREMDNGYRILHRDLWNKIRLYKKKQKPVFKLKKKEILKPKSP